MRVSTFLYRFGMSLYLWGFSLAWLASLPADPAWWNPAAGEMIALGMCLWGLGVFGYARRVRWGESLSHFVSLFRGED